MSAGGKGSRFGALETERAREGFPALDAGVAAVRALAESAAGAARVVGRAAAAIDLAAQHVAAAVRDGGAVVFFGAGTSGRIAVMEAVELWPTFRFRARGEMAGGRKALLNAVEGAEDDAPAGARAARALGRGDVAIGVTASGVTPFVRGALDAARKGGATTVLVTSHPRSPIRAAVMVSLPTGPEPLAGSTRMNAGTATKVALNALTTTAMARAGKTWRNRMVDVLPTNRKLVARARRLVQELGEVRPAEAARLLKAGGSVKAAIVAARLRCSAGEARRRLAAASGSIRDVLGP